MLRASELNDNAGTRLADMLAALDRQSATRTDLAHNVIDFARLLRSNEFAVSPPEVHDALRSMVAIDLGDRREFYLTLRAIFLWTPDRQPLFDDLFDRFWGSGDLGLPGPDERVVQSSDVSKQGTQSVEQGLSYSSTEVLLYKDFADFRADELTAVARACVAIARRIATRKSRRFRVTSRGVRIDARRTVRRNIKYGGTVLELARLDRKVRKPRLVLLCDVSRSMEQYSVFLLQFVHSMQNVIGKVESFVFSTALHRVSSYFKHADIMTAVEDISKEVPDWSGGTRIGESLRTFNEEFARRLVDGRTIVVILSDGLDTGQTDLLAQEMAKVHRRAAQVIWLNPLLGRDSYQPLARGMSAALPFVDVFAAAHNLASLQELARVLSRGHNAPGSKRELTR